MAIYVQETGRSYENPVDSEDYNKTWSGAEADAANVPNGYQITYEDNGPGGYKFGKDEVFYIGERQETCVAFCASERRTIFRFYSGKLRNHLYSKNKEVKEDEHKHRSYNREPRQRGARYFTTLRDSVSGTVRLRSVYNSSEKNHKLETGNGGGENLGYIWTSESNANSSGLLVTGEAIRPLYHYRHPGDSKRGPNDFYTVNPVVENNLETGVSGVPDCNDPRGEEYRYQGIIGYVTLTPGPRAIARYEEIGGPQSTGLVNRSSWYDWVSDNDSNGNRRPYGTPYTIMDYLKDRDGVPATSSRGWGNSVDLLDTDAYFEWFYGKNGAVKAAVPRSINFHDAFEGQFVFYLYDTSYPWNGPIYGINFFETDAPCLPTSYRDDSTPPEPTLTYHNYNYVIRQDAWVTKKTTLFVDAPDLTPGANESFWTAGTDDHRIFFRYLTGSGFFKIGERINGWMITACRYFGDEMNCGYMELSSLQQEGQGSAFTYGQNFTSANNGVITVLAGYGIPNKGAFWGVFEFPKQVSYMRVEIDKNALIPQRTIDEAVLQAKIDKKGRVQSVKIINSGKDYVNPQLSCEFPEVLREQGFADSGSNVDEFFEDDFSTKVQLDVEDETDFKRFDKKVRRSASKISNKSFVTESDVNGTLEAAEFKAVLDDNGSIIDVIITNKGRGYSPGTRPKVLVVDRETGIRKDKYVAEGMNPYEVEIKRSLSQFGNNDASANAALQADRDIILENSQLFNTEKTTIYPRGYIKMGDVNAEEKQKFCDKIVPGLCFQPDSGKGWSDWAQYYDEQALFGNLRGLDGDFNANNGMLGDLFSRSRPYADQIEEKLSNGMAGIFPGGCVEVAQSNLYGVRRFFDIPCPYQSFDSEGNELLFGWMPYKYCASKLDLAKVKVSIQVDGDVSGAGAAVNTRFMNWLKSLGRPQLTRPRKVPKSGGTGDEKTHPCTNGDAKGRCYETSSGQYAFVPLGGDENTFDYGLNQGMTELDQLETWIGSGNYGTFSPFTWTSYEYSETTTTDPNTGQTSTSQSNTGNFTGGAGWGTYNSVTLNSCSGGKFSNDNWHNFVTDGVLTVNSGYDNSGNPITANDLCSNPPFQGCLALNEVQHAAIAIDPKRINDDNHIEMGPYEGSMLWRNYSTGSARLLDETLNNYGNPYFDECDITFD